MISKYATVKVPKLKFQDIKNYNQPDYKAMWEELKYEYISGESKQFENNIVKHIEQKYNLGGE